MAEDPKKKTTPRSNTELHRKLDEALAKGRADLQKENKALYEKAQKEGLIDPVDGIREDQDGDDHLRD